MNLSVCSTRCIQSISQASLRHKIRGPEINVDRGLQRGAALIGWHTNQTTTGYRPAAARLKWWRNAGFSEGRSEEYRSRAFFSKSTCVSVATAWDIEIRLLALWRFFDKGSFLILSARDQFKEQRRYIGMGHGARNLEYAC